MPKGTCLTVATWLVLTGAIGCVDTSPLPYTKTSTQVAKDAGSDAPLVDGAWRQACVSCVESEPTCSFALCAKDPRCLEFHQCVVDLGCLALPELNARIDCGKSCFQKVGVLDYSDPSLQLYFPINGCTLGGAPCAGACLLK